MANSEDAPIGVSESIHIKDITMPDAEHIAAVSFRVYCRDRHWFLRGKVILREEEQDRMYIHSRSEWGRVAGLVVQKYDYHSGPIDLKVEKSSGMVWCVNDTGYDSMVMFVGPHEENIGASDVRHFQLHMLLNSITESGLKEAIQAKRWKDVADSDWVLHQCKIADDCIGNLRTVEGPKSVGEPIDLSDFVGPQNLVDRARLLVSMMRDPDMVRRRGTELPRGVLFYGPPGTGKTHLAQLIARESGAGFQLVMASDVFEMWIGSSERNLVKILIEAEERAESEGRLQILFFDEMEVLMRSRDQANAHRVDGSVLSTLLAYMSKSTESVGNQTGKRKEKSASIPPRSGKVIILGASNKPELSDEAALREGRFDWKLYVGPPETDEERMQLFSLYLEKASERAGSPMYDITPEALLEVAAYCPGFSGAQIKAVVEQVLQRKIERELLHGESWSPVNAEELKRVAMDIAISNDAVGDSHGRDGEPLWKGLF